ncbi:MAG: hypothetical protein M3Q64_00640 [bacterium]|nr:hypothetical protein [bacterium]
MPIFKFYGVSASFDGQDRSLYLVIDQCDINGTPHVQKIDGTNFRSIDKNARLAGGRLVGITRNHGIMVYQNYFDEPNHVQRPSLMHAHTSGRSGPITGLFLSESKARECFERTDLKQWDVRYQESTDETLIAIGDNHPLFILDDETSTRLEILTKKTVCV